MEFGVASLRQAAHSHVSAAAAAAAEREGDRAGLRRGWAAAAAAFDHLIHVLGSYRSRGH